MRHSCPVFHAPLKLRFVATDSERQFMVSKSLTPCGMCLPAMTDE
jgi:hypothetical protein